MKRLYISALAALICIVSCDKKEELVEIGGKTVEPGGTIEMALEVGETYSFRDDIENFSDYTWTSSDESVALFHEYANVHAVSGGKATLKASKDDKEFSILLTVNSIEHGDIYLNFEYDESFYYYVNQKLQPDHFEFLTSDTQGNLYCGTAKGNGLTLYRNGTKVADGMPLKGRNPKLYVKDGKAYVLTNSQDMTESFCYVMGTDGKWRAIDVHPGQNKWMTGQGIIHSAEEDSAGNIVIWGNMRNGFLAYPHVWVVDKDDNISFEHDDNMPSGEYGELDAEENRYLVTDVFGYKIWKGSEIKYTLPNKAEITNWGKKFRMMFRGDDLWFAQSEIIKEDEDWTAKDYALTVYRNGKLIQSNAICKGIAGEFSGIDMCITPSGDIYTIGTDCTVVRVWKNGTLIVSLPYLNCNNPSLAVIDK